MSAFYSFPFPFAFLFLSVGDDNSDSPMPSVHFLSSSFSHTVLTPPITDHALHAMLPHSFDIKTCSYFIFSVL